jgi:hypothetical protein
MGPRSQQHHRQIGLLGAQRPEQLRALLSRGGIGAEVHVRDDQVHALNGKRREPFMRIERGESTDVVQPE